MVMVRMVVRLLFILSLLSLLPYLLGLTVAGQEAVVEFHHLHEPTHSDVQTSPQSTTPTLPPIAVSVSEAVLPVVSSSVVLAERWLRNYVLSHFPSINITTIVVGKGVICSRHHEHQWGLVLPSARNLHYSLVRWGLVREIKVSVAFSSECLDHAEELLKPLLTFLQDTSSLYTIDPSFHSSSPPEKTTLLVSSHKSTLEKLGFSKLKVIWLKEPEKLISRRLTSSFISSPYPEKPKPIAFPAPATAPQTSRTPPSSPFASSPDGSFSFVPSASPSEIPGTPPDVFTFPPSPCPAVPAAVPAPAAAGEEKGGLWCVAKPAVPAETLQEAMDYACGAGGADCEEIKPQGSCYYPDNVVAHASFAFNSYWQKTKGSGGSCGFEGTAILINSDPSFLHCKFVLK